MQFRHELKHEITVSDMIAIRQRLRAVATPDPHAVSGKYLIRSLYFDTPEDKALLEKQSGVSRRNKFRIRFYNGDTSVIHLEKKCKTANLGCKVSAPLTAEQAQSIVDGNIEWMKDSEYDLVRELYSKMVSERLRPRTIVDYTREPFIFGPGNVRVTLDYDIRSGLGCVDFLNNECVTVPAAGGTCILEVKWDNFLPDIIRDAVQLPHARTGAFSKYEVCRQPII
ncbi:polyphosphate polymerase domain-containing protein [Butyrivibrio sp. CB08]|uniref:polyphosphate polymerase domain-containing protein n=1 Tax=Butyrivibrio sp. CB08 TaxID=2364879 RepID=UPI000EA9E07B|nr:polyphosphate polymerase domain-containing protein [Butyrivibrio sp. CB08]RKM62010.1 polyphosphate polymerase domain-containing protein [Butyrivibrio sp. CB08]